MAQLLPNVPLLILLAIATVQDVRTRHVSCWVTYGSVLSGVLVAFFHGPPALLTCVAGIAVGGLLLPLALKGGLGLADPLLLAGVGAWGGPLFGLQSLLLASLIGGLLAVVAIVRGERAIPYVPAIAAGVALLLAARACSS